jgi:addiction module HigA family antidote
VSAAAKALRVSRKTLSGILNGHAGVSPEMAIRLAIAFDTTPESWLAQQAQYDLWKAGKKRKSLERMVKILAA